MSHPAIDPYQPPLAEPKLTAADAADVKRRDIAIFVLLNVITVGIYWFYVVYQWSKEINGLLGRVKYPPVVVLLANILTCGLAGMVFECLFAFDVTEASRSRNVGGRLEQLGIWVIVANCAAVMLALIPFVGLPFAMALGILASSLVQMELNRLADAQSGKYR